MAKQKRKTEIIQQILFIYLFWSPFCGETDARIDSFINISQKKLISFQNT